MTASAHDVAAQIRRLLPGVEALELHKLLYFCQGCHLATFDEPLFREQIMAWDLGPVIAVLWMDERARLAAPPEALCDAELNTVAYIVSRYGRLTGRELMLLTHDQAPWQQADKSRPAGKQRPISNESIRDYFAAAA